MELDNINEITIFEHQFWLQILGDHARFIFNTLSPREDVLIKQAEMFINTFDNLLKTSRYKISENELNTLNTEIYKAVLKIRQFKLDIISNQITGKIDISLPPSLINHMVNELDDYLLILNAITKKVYYNASPIYLHLLWLPDSSGHASFIANNLDMTQKQIIKTMKKYSKKFDNLYFKAIDFNGYMRTNIDEFPAFDQLNYDANKLATSFKETLKDLEGYVTNKKVLSTLNTLVFDHMFRETCYYLTKLALVSSIDKPDCDPTKPRVEA